MKAPKTFYSAHQPKQWNPDTLIELTSCFGTTLKGPRCRNPVAKAKVAYARAILNELAIMDPWTASNSPRLLDAVSIMLCYRHTNQVAEVADQWKAQILNCTYAAYTKGYDKYACKDTNFSQPGDEYTTNWNSGNSRTRFEDYDIAELFAILKVLEALRKASKGRHFSTQHGNYFTAQQRGHFSTQQGSPFNTHQGNHFNTQQGSHFNTQQGSYFNTQQGSQFNTQQESQFNTQQESYFNTQQETQFNTQQESYFSTQQGDPPRQQPSREQRGQEDEEKRRMHEHAQKEGRAKGEEEEKQQREGERQERENRDPTRMQAREKDPGTQGYAQAWRRYYAGWEAVEESKDKVGLDRIPWPTESGKWEDVTVNNVRAFFQKAAPVHMPGEERFRILSRENKRWHTDKIISRFGHEALKAPCADALNTIAKLMVELRKEAKMRREG